jgi:dUTP pyrophosphatase
METITINVKKLDDRAIIPTHGTIDAAGWDLYADLPEGEDEVVINPHQTCKISAGIAMAIPTGYWAGLYARSGMATKNDLAPANKTGVIDADYRGPIIVALHNHGEEVRKVVQGERIAQLVLHKVIPVTLNETSDLDETERGAGGFGSTGTK